MMKSLRNLSAMLGVGGLALGLLAVIAGGGRPDQVAAIGHTLILAGAILIAGVLISGAIAGSGSK
jgi:hypothetical protein